MSETQANRDELAERKALITRLASMERGALESLAAQLLQTYVVEGLAPAGASGESAYDLVGEETFAGMLRRLKTERPQDPILARFVVNGEHVQVRTNMGNVDLTDYQRVTAPGSGAPAGAPPPPAMPTPRDSVYNRDLYKQAGDAKSAPSAAPAKSPGSAPAPAAKQAASAPASSAPKPPAAPGSDAKDAKQAERFRMIELD